MDPPSIAVRLRKLDNKCKRGWWMISNGKLMDQVRSAFHGRGIRERVLHRLLVKDNFTFNASPHLDRPLTVGEINRAMIARLNRLIGLFEQKVVAANLHDQNFKPAAGDGREDDTDSVDSEDTWNMDDDYEHHMTDETENRQLHLTEYHEFKALKLRLLEVEKNIERRYMKHPYYAGSTIPVEKILRALQRIDPIRATIETNSIIDGSETHVETESESSTNSSCQYKSASITVDESGNTERLQRWRDYVQNAATGGQIMFALQALESAVAWDKSIMRARCQICRTSENDPYLLICDGCDLAYHTYCFRVSMKNYFRDND
ncbi:unnamed protein product [Gongylonema pulchrum]|uniref:PHD-type domain-containing protein n=1 Tax=Gongylonema pulchrum TaxID=637853 RepID=A0A183EP67_9BILA|nr:unnamed protein product [Gongylonema pulchrum]